MIETPDASEDLPEDLIKQTGEESAQAPRKAPSSGAQPAPAEPSGQPTSVADAFPEMVSDPQIQGDLEAELAPPVAPWTVEQAQALADYIAKIGEEGLDPADYRLDQLLGLIEEGPSEALDALASEMFVWLVEDLRDGRTPMEARKQWFVHDPDYRRFPSARLLAQAVESGDIAGVLDRLKPTHPDYALLREELAKTPAEDEERRQLIRANMDRWRWLPRDLGLQYLLTNVPEYQLRLVVNGKIIASYRTIVGKPGRTATPQLAEMVEGVIFNPTWTVPQSIVKGEGLGAKVLANPQWAARMGYKATKGANGWITVVQQPGPANALGKMKLDMPNRHAIFLHDTPSRNLFNREKRALSHGCIRVERALELAITIAILGGGATKEEAVKIAMSREYTRVPILKEMPVYITYFTMASDIDGALKTFEDIYGRDPPVIASFAEPRQANRAHFTSEPIVEIVDDLRI